MDMLLEPSKRKFSMLRKANKSKQTVYQGLGSTAGQRWSDAVKLLQETAYITEISFKKYCKCMALTPVVCMLPAHILHCNHCYFVYHIIPLRLKIAKAIYFKTTKKHSLFFDLLCTQTLVVQPIPYSCFNTTPTSPLPCLSVHRKESLETPKVLHKQYCVL